MGPIHRAGRSLRLRIVVVVAAAQLVLPLAPADAQSPPGQNAPPLLVPPANRPAASPPIISPPAERSPIVANAAPEPLAIPANPLPSPAAPPPAASPIPETFTPSEEFQAWITQLVREHLPDKYEKTKNWGHTTKVWDGVKLRLEDGRLETKRRWKEANDGTWYKYRIDLVQPEKHFDIQIRNIRETAGGKITAEIRALARLKCFGRMSQWEHGVQLLSLSADAETSVVVTAQVDLGMRLDFTESTPAVRLLPEVKAARIDIYDFRLQRVSNAKGPIVKSLSSSVREVVEDRLEEQNRGKLADKLNQQIAKQQDKLRLSLPEVVKSPFAALLPKEATP